MICKACGKKIIEVGGNRNSKILFVGDCPSPEEVKRGYAFVGETGRVLEYEAGKVGLCCANRSEMNLWYHYKTDRKECLEESKAYLKEIAQDKEAILLMGSEVCQELLNRKAADILGMDVTELARKMFPNARLVMVSPGPSAVLHGTVGEFRLSLEKFVRMIKERKIWMP